MIALAADLLIAALSCIILLTIICFLFLCRSSRKQQPVDTPSPKSRSRVPTARRRDTSAREKGLIIPAPPTWEDSLLTSDSNTLTLSPADLRNQFGITASESEQVRMIDQAVRTSMSDSDRPVSTDTPIRSPLMAFFNVRQDIGTTAAEQIHAPITPVITGTGARGALVLGSTPIVGARGPGGRDWSGVGPDEEVEQDAQDPEVAMAMASELETLADELLKADRYEEALDEYQKALRYLDVHPALPEGISLETKRAWPTVLVRILLSIALTGVRIGTPLSRQLTISCASRVLILQGVHPTDQAKASHSRGLAYLANGDEELAEQDLNVSTRVPTEA